MQNILAMVSPNRQDIQNINPLPPSSSDFIKGGYEIEPDVRVSRYYSGSGGIEDFVKNNNNSEDKHFKNSSNYYPK
jgi:hypothetical protein